MYTDKARSKEHKALRNVANKQLETTKAEGAGIMGGMGYLYLGEETSLGLLVCAVAYLLFPQRPCPPGIY